MTDKVEFQRSEQKCLPYSNIGDIVRSASDIYLKIRVDLEMLDMKCSSIVRHIKSYPDWEYFLDAFTEGGRDIMEYSKFNAVRVFNNVVEMKYEPIGARFDGNNFSFGVCSVEDILNIEEIIENRKRKYHDTEEE